jgi:hypothetical protein
LFVIDGGDHVLFDLTHDEFLWLNDC